MKVLTYTSFKEHCDLYTEIHGSIAVNSFRPNFHKKADKCTGAENTKFIGFNLSAVAYSINDFNAKIKVEILQQRQDWEPPQIEDLRLVIPKDWQYYFYRACYTGQISWKDYANQVNFVPWLIQNISWYITSFNIIVAVLQTNQQSQKRVGWTAIKLAGLHACF